MDVHGLQGEPITTSGVHLCEVKETRLRSPCRVSARRGGSRREPLQRVSGIDPVNHFVGLLVLLPCFALPVSLAACFSSYLASGHSFRVSCRFFFFVFWKRKGKTAERGLLVPLLVPFNNVLVTVRPVLRTLAVVLHVCHPIPLQHITSDHM